MAVAAAQQRRAAPRGRGHRRRRDDGRHGLRGAESRRLACRPTCSSCSTTTTCRSPRTSARCRTTSRACSPGAFYAHLREGGKKVLRADAHRVGARAPLRGAHEGHGAAGHAVRGDGLQLHRPDRRPRHEGAGAARCATCASCTGPQFLHVVTQQGQGLCAGRGRPDQVARPGPVRSGERHDLQGKEHRPDLLAGLRPVAVRHGRARPAHRRHHAGHARRLGPGRVLEALSRSATSTSPSPSSTR